MNWANDRAAREHSNATYGAEWKRQRQKALERAGRRCEKCSSNMELTVDHVVPVSQGGTHDQANLQVLCGTHHREKTATEGRGYRKRRDPEPRPRTVW